jgi:hypothetical protein
MVNRKIPNTLSAEWEKKVITQFGGSTPVRFA